MNRTVKRHIIVEASISKAINKKNKILLKEFKEYLHSIDRSERTIKAYDNDIQIFFTWNYKFNSNKAFTRLKKKDVASFQNYVITQWGWSPNRIARVKSSLNSFSNYIENILDDEYPNYRAVIDKIPTPAIQNVFDQTIVTEEEVDITLRKLLEDRKYQLACIFALAAFSGSRRSELLQFKAGWFEDDNIVPGTSLYVTPEKIRTKGRGAIGKPMIKYTLCEFREYYELWMKERKKFGITNEYLFVNKKGEQCKDCNLQSFARTISRYLGKPFYFHCLRHQLCTRLRKKGIPADVVQTYFGWESVKMVEIYNDSDSVEKMMQYFVL